MVQKRGLGGPSRATHSTAVDPSEHGARGHGMLPSVETRARRHRRRGGGARRPAVGPGPGVRPNQHPFWVRPAGSSATVRQGRVLRQRYVCKHILHSFSLKCFFFCNEMEGGLTPCKTRFLTPRDTVLRGYQST